MSAEENKALIRRYFEAIDTRRDPIVVDEFLAPDFVSHNPSPGFGSDREGQKGAFAHFLAAAPDGYHVIDDMVAEGDRVVTRLTAHGTQTGELFGIPPTGKRLTMTGVAIHRIRDGKIAEHWHEIDMLGGLQQLGVIPAPGQSGT
ncbi:MAG: ester cyclase [Chloroflexota bacterium]|nr:ester cyclase [Chloroflexota bacterium]